MIHEMMRGRPASCILLFFQNCRQAFTGYFQVRARLLFVCCVFLACHCLCRVLGVSLSAYLWGCDVTMTH